MVINGTGSILAVGLNKVGISFVIMLEIFLHLISHSLIHSIQLQLLASTDYKQTKWKDCAMTDADYEPIRAKRASWRAAYNKIECATTAAEIYAAVIEAE